MSRSLEPENLPETNPFSENPDPNLQASSRGYSWPVSMSRGLGSENLTKTNPSSESPSEEQAQKLHDKHNKFMRKKGQFNDQQRRAPYRVRKLKTGTMLVRGPGVTSKTYTTIRLTGFILENTDHCVFIGPQNHEVSDYISEKAEEERLDPLRLATVSISSLDT
ncbi:uncharacterized protein MYCFIDRAFT_175608 [Pseudocercospora fijiensis CIRAD86]|uniref:Uncharacterized protein n=1 Tax=Pseudocercospora fijiensis (strain CIRAD86) TaxID=383855 RepID=M2YWF7_PSEFD|nr:uncharacterized protein MYCFIDRAFT_175608 [Pseudocercospora fijiensis CIRAD86]EME82060.1 hypothetical protein MYCFIDRAFT_175608 [Pseudocercospora fijiensis CIRAD86]